MQRSLIIFLMVAGLQPSLCLAQRKDTTPVEVGSEAKRRAEAEALQKKKAQEEARKKAVTKELKTESSTGTSGLQLLKIPVTGVYYLGMRQREYDSLVSQNPLSVTTDRQRYELHPRPYYFYGRLYMLSLYLPDSIFSSALPDITTHYMSKLGTPDEKKISDTLLIFPSEEDSSLNGAYRVQEATISWRYNTHEIIIGYRLTDMKNGLWKGFYGLRYTGTLEFVKSLGRLEEKEKSKITGN